jgi:hypothetical protein
VLFADELSTSKKVAMQVGEIINEQLSALNPDAPQQLVGALPLGCAHWCICSDH